jgi:alpha-tubulin suppressor-like RCC1 family protein
LSTANGNYTGLIVSIEASYSSSYFVGENGAIYGWGLNVHGQLGIGTFGVSGGSGPTSEYYTSGVQANNTLFATKIFSKIVTTFSAVYLLFTDSTVFMCG